MKPILAIAKLTLKAAFRFRIVALLSLFLVVSVTALPLLIKDDGTARGFVQILLTYSMGLTVTTLGLATLWLSCGILARDIEDCRIQLVVVKPVARWKIWMGKWLGILVLNAMLLGASGLVIYGLLEYRGGKLNEDQKFVLENEVFVARGSAKEPAIDLTRTVEEIFQDRMKQSSLQDVDHVQLKKQIFEMLKHQFQLVPQSMMREWDIPLGVKPAELKDKPLYIRTKFIAMSHNSTFEDTRSFPMFFEVGPMDSPQSWRVVMLLTPNVFHEIEVPPNLLDENGHLQVRFINNQNETFYFDVNEGMEVLYRQGGFLANYLKGLVILFCWLALLAAIGLAASSFLSFPVASFFAVSVLILGLSTGTMNQVIEEGGITGVDHETGKVEERGMLDHISVFFFKELKNLTEVVLNFSPVELLSEGRTVSWWMVCKAVGQVVILVGGIFVALGVYCFSRRELALPSGGQG